MMLKCIELLMSDVQGEFYIISGYSNIMMVKTDSHQ